MGLFSNIFRRKEEEKPIQIKEQESKQATNEFAMGENVDGSQFFEYFNDNPKPGQVYDITRVVIKGESENIADSTLYKCLVSWFKRCDGHSEKEHVVTTDYREVIAGIDPVLMREDLEYFELVMKGLFDRNKVERHMENSLKTEDELYGELEKSPDSGAYPCGKYIGGVEKRNGKLEETFSIVIGEIMHNLPSMREERDEYRKDYIREDIKAKTARYIEEAERYERDLGE